MAIIQYEHHDTKVFVDEANRGKHRENCLCWKGCKNFKPEDREVNCPIANMVFSLDCTYGLVTPVFECPNYNS